MTQATCRFFDARQCSVQRVQWAENAWRCRGGDRERSRDLIIEQIEGASFNDVLRKRITGPLGMYDTSLMLRDGTVMKRLAAHYTKRAEGWGIEEYGGGDRISTLDDMVNWQQNLVDPRVGTVEMYHRMATPCVFDNGATGFYGLGVVTDVYRGRRAVGHSGGVAGGKSEWMRFIDDGLGIVIIANNDQVAAFGVARQIADIYFGTPAPAPIQLAPGRYRQEGGPDVFEIVAKNGVPTFVRSGCVLGFDFGHPGGAKPSARLPTLFLVHGRTERWTERSAAPRGSTPPLTQTPRRPPVPPDTTPTSRKALRSKLRGMYNVGYSCCAPISA
ncbi:serine hydrolase domain-containing protein [Mesorhizobium sp. RIZ17]|uniref:serine hydrolase domain-containing protein n=1 Tax=Mesorhizobium sp. RIZ17 TaxID=3132743 RepID=UPI003DA7CC82